jgi:hypothetical protein
MMQAVSVNAQSLDLSGHYVLKSKTKKQHGVIYGRMGKMDVTQLSSSRILVDFWFDGGAPSNGMAVFSDTLVLKGNEATYMNSKKDFTCKVIFSFSEGKVDLMQTGTEKYPCGFGYLVDVSGEYVRKKKR